MFAVCSNSAIDLAAENRHRVWTTLPSGKATAFGKSSFDCNVCHRSFTKEYNLLIHERTHKDDPLNVSVCDICGKVFSKSEAMRNHRVNHSPPSVPKELKSFFSESVSYD